ncbi:hypothetical protein PIL02S_00826 [Paenibacillus illinoisensis]|jgi:hypothetical protein|uniref:Uncharacterized protein n=1 Tax=Paenibacillus illinoisensis TaxID=59845 RepID=A0A2W0CES6_9BACL|nr:hypothetical protein PIL02S_00826 [Paenibacillus illinoisensis]
MQNNLEKMLESMENRLGSSRNGDDRMNLEKRSKGSSVGGVGYVRTPSLAMP